MELFNIFISLFLFVFTVQTHIKLKYFVHDPKRRKDMNVNTVKRFFGGHHIYFVTLEHTLAKNPLFATRATDRSLNVLP